MKDAMEVIRTQVKGLRLSKTSVHPWTLYGPIDQALKTSIQAESVKFSPITVDVHGVEVEVELWTSGTGVSGQETQPNQAAMIVLMVQKLRAKGASLHEIADGIVVGVASPEDMEMVVGPAILTGAGGTDIPDVVPGCLLHSLMGS